MMTSLLILHGLLAVALLGALTHQALAVAWPANDTASFARRFRAVSGPAYTNTIILLFLVTFTIGMVIYPAYRLNVRTYLQDYRMFAAEGTFEIKEHLAAIALGLLPLYWILWRRPSLEGVGADGVAQGARWARIAVTLMIAVAAWTSFFVGHILNNIRGLFGT
jgi:hypothetical protein